MKKEVITIVFFVLFVLGFSIVWRDSVHLTYFSRMTGNSPVILKKEPIYKSVPSSHQHLVLNYSNQIHPPVQCIPFTTIKGIIPICVHDRANEFITKEIRKTRKWEPEVSQSLQNILLSDPEYGLLDIGANIGMYGLLGANLQRQVLSVEAMDININKFHQSIVINNFEKFITLVTRPLSDKHETLLLTAGVSNLGMSRLLDTGQSMRGLARDRYNAKEKTAVMLDDLIDLMPRKKAIMVIDVEGNEGKVFRGGQKFFEAVNITHIFMEGNLLSENDRKFAETFLSKYHYKSYSGSSFMMEVKLPKDQTWPVKIYLKKQL